MQSPINKLRYHTKRTVARLKPSLYSRKRTIIRFARQAGLVYFGAVDQHTDEHHVIRGLTLSSGHMDDNYCIGSIDTYDIVFVDRTDVITSPRTSPRTHNWLIVEIELHTSYDLPHIFLGSHHHTDSSYAKLFSTFTSLRPVQLGVLSRHSPEFHDRYSLYSTPTTAIETEQLFTAEMTRTIAAHFWPFAAEIHEGSLFVYADNKKVTTHLLTTLLRNTLWLAKQLDEQAALLQHESRQ